MISSVYAEGTALQKVLEWLGKNPSIAAALITAVVGSFLTGLFWPAIKAAIGNLWDGLKTFFSGRRFENRYLEWVVQEHRYLPVLPTTLVPVTEAHRQELDTLYVALTVAGAAGESSGTTLADALQRGHKLVILGDPGAGKTTMLRFLALTFARARRNKPLGSGDERRTDAVRVRNARARVRKEFGFEDYPLCVFVYLNRLRDIASWKKGRSILDALRDGWRSVDTLRQFPENFFDQHLQSGSCIFLFDAFDELGTQEAREAIARHIGELATSVPQGNRFLVTSRIVGYGGQLAKYGFSVLRVEQLTWNLIAELVGKWYEALEEPHLAQQLLDALRANPRIRELAINPMLLSLIALVQYVKRLIPDRRHVLYDECVKILIERRYAPPAVQEAFNKVLPAEEAIVLLRKIAYDLHSHERRDVPRGVLESALLPAILKDMAKSRAIRIQPPEIVRNIEERSQLLVERGLDDQGRPLMAFSHLTFQEYLTSLELNLTAATKGRAAVTADLLSQYGKSPNWWEEVALLFAAQLDPEDQETFFQELLPLRGGSQPNAIPG